MYKTFAEMIDERLDLSSLRLAGSLMAQLKQICATFEFFLSMPLGCLSATQASKPQSTTFTHPQWQS